MSIRAASALRAIAAALLLTACAKPEVSPLLRRPLAATGVLLESAWGSGLGSADAALTDGGRWAGQVQWDNPPAPSLAVTAEGPSGLNALRVTQYGDIRGAMVWKTGLMAPGQSYYLRFYFKNADTSGAGDHLVVANPVVGGVGYENLTLLRKYGGASDYRVVVSMFGCGNPLGWPWEHWGPGSDSGSDRLTNGQWYRFEYFVEFVGAGRVRVHPRIYDAGGALRYTEADYKQEGYGTSTKTMDGSNTWTLGKFYAAGKSFCVDPGPLTSLAIGNNGQSGASPTGRFWYFAAVQVRTDTWPGPVGGSSPAVPGLPSGVNVR